MRTPSTRRARGFTLLEMLVALAIMGIVVAMATLASVRLMRDQATRQAITDLQTNARQGLGLVQRDLRRSALGVGSGVVWTTSGGVRVSRPAIQLFAGLAGGGFLDVKPGTDALLVVGALGTARAASVGVQVSSVSPVAVTTAAGFAANGPVLLGDYGDASWGIVASVNAAATPPLLTLADASVNVFPGQIVPQPLAAGSMVRAARSRLYYVDVNDELVRLDLLVPRAPASLAETALRSIMATGVENLQVDCELDAGTAGFQACPAVLGATDPIATESAAAFGTLASGRGPRLTPATVGLLRTVTASAVARSVRPVNGSQGDPPIALSGVTLPVGGGDATANYVRRAYSVSAAVRNTSLGAF